LLDEKGTVGWGQRCHKLSGDIQTQVYVKVVFRRRDCIYGNGDLREGSVRRGPGHGPEGEGGVSGDGRRRRRSWRNEQEAEMSGDPGTGRSGQVIIVR
jgi:hypothetical protein